MQHAPSRFSLLALALLLTACGSGTAQAPTQAPPSAQASPVPQGSAVAPGSPSASPAATLSWPSPPAMSIDTSKQYTATINTTDGSMTADLYASEDPITVNNFVFLAQQNFYNGIIFHRIIKGFMAQTGDPTGTGSGGPGYKFQDEPVTRPYVRGTLAMANAGPNTDGSQFFIVDQNQPTLPKSYTIFGQVTGGLDTLDKIMNTPVGPSATREPSRPLQQVSISSITISQS